jgi:4-methylaminobutanoate oxidase (formaldehyde-forming)
MTNDIPKHAQIVIVGGGILGASTAYHLALNGCTDVVVLERAKLTSGTTWHAAGLVRRLRSSATLTNLISASIELYQSLEVETGQATGWRETGSLAVAANADRMTQLKRQVSLARGFGLDAELLPVTEVPDYWPLVRTDDLIGAVFSPGDGRVNPSDTASALVKGARGRGVRFFEDTPVQRIEKNAGRASAVVTPLGRIECENVVLCAGLWSRDLALLAGAHFPLYACEHFYILTKPIPGIDRHLPTLSAQDSYLYIRDEVGGLLVGCFEPNAKPLPLSRLPTDFAFDLLDEDWDHLEPMLKNAIHRIPALETAEIRMLLNGPESFTLDNNFMLGESAEVPGLFLGCGMNSVGIASAGGAGRALAEWIIEGEATMDLLEVDVRRFTPQQNVLRALHDRIPEVLGKHYEILFPGAQPQSVRGARRTALYDAHVRKGARFGNRNGWERAEVFAPKAEQEGWRLTFGRPPWHGAAEREYTAAKEAVALLDQSSYGKILLSGPDSARGLNRIVANDIDVAPGRVVYTAMVNHRGGYESDVTVQRWDEETFLVVTGSGQINRDIPWIRSQIASKERVTLLDVTSAWSLLGLAGPNAEALLRRLCPDDTDLSTLQPYHHRETELGFARTRLARMSYTGEPGFEILLPTDMTAGVHDCLHDAGEDLGLRDIGSIAVNSLRLEKGFRSWGHDLSPGVTPFDAGLERFVAWDKAGSFRGREALMGLRDATPAHRLITFSLADANALPIGGEPLFRDEHPMGQVTSTGYGHGSGHAIGLAYVAADALDERCRTEDLEIEIACQRFQIDGRLAP